MAEMACHFGHADAAMAAIADAIDAGLLDLGWLERCPTLASVRGRADFAAMRARVEERALRVIAAFEAPLDLDSAQRAGAYPGAATG